MANLRRFTPYAVLSHRVTPHQRDVCSLLLTSKFEPLKPGRHCKLNDTSYLQCGFIGVEKYFPRESQSSPFSTKATSAGSMDLLPLCGIDQHYGFSNGTLVLKLHAFER